VSALRGVLDVLIVSHLCPSFFSPEQPGRLLFFILCSVPPILLFRRASRLHPRGGKIGPLLLCVVPPPAASDLLVRFARFLIEN